MKIIGKTILSCAVALAATVASAAERPFGYLFAHFKNGGLGAEQIYFAVSRDGLHWKSLNNGAPVLESTVGEQGVRDPFLVRNPETGRVYMIATDLCIARSDWGKAQTRGSKSLVVWETDDMTDWKGPRLVRVATDESGCTWAPEAIWDAKSKDFFVFWASMGTIDGIRKQRIFSARTKDFQTFTPARLYIEKPNHIIDTDIVEDNGVYYRFSKDETVKSIIMERSDSLEGDWTPVDAFPSGQVLGYEGPQCYRLNDGTARWCLLLDYFSKGKGYQAFLADDLASGDFKPAPGVLSFPYPFRHGGVLPLSKKEYEAVVKKWGDSKR